MYLYSTQAGSATQSWSGMQRSDRTRLVYCPGLLHQNAVLVTNCQCARGQIRRLVRCLELVPGVLTGLSVGARPRGASGGGLSFIDSNELSRRDSLMC